MSLVCSAFPVLFVSVKVKVKVEAAVMFGVAVVVGGGIRGTQCWVRSGVLRFTRIKLIRKTFTDQLDPHVHFIVANQV